MELNLEAMMQEAANNVATLNNRCMILAGENAALKAQLKAKDDQLKELASKLGPDNVVQIKKEPPKE